MGEEDDGKKPKTNGGLGVRKSDEERKEVIKTRVDFWVRRKLEKKLQEFTVQLVNQQTSINLLSLG